MAEENSTPVSAKKTVTGLPENSEAALTYVLGWLTGIVFLILQKENKKIRFHALQSIVLFGGINLLTWVLGALTFGFGGLLLSPVIGIATFVLWLVLVFKTYQGEEMNIPVVTDFVKKQLK